MEKRVLLAVIVNTVWVWLLRVYPDERCESLSTASCGVYKPLAFLTMAIRSAILLAVERKCTGRDISHIVRDLGRSNIKIMSGPSAFS